MAVNWDKFRRGDRTIDLLKVFDNEYAHERLISKQRAVAVSFIKLTEQYQLIESRQVAAVALAAIDVLITMS
jgi:hypothetical protein